MTRLSNGNNQLGRVQKFVLSTRTMIHTISVDSYLMCCRPVHGVIDQMHRLYARNAFCQYLFMTGCIWASWYFSPLCCTASLLTCIRTGKGGCASTMYQASNCAIFYLYPFLLCYRLAPQLDSGRECVFIPCSGPQLTSYLSQTLISAVGD